MTKRIVLTCSVCSNRNYTTQKGKAAEGKRMEVRKYCKHCGAHTIHRETK
ncbi:50S ribosomal protein L33 [Lentibacillus sp. JNUCC-1]|nr:50S ribosomal protein L33 [Lentibacillus sp. JNUCC-1]